MFNDLTTRKQRMGTMPLEMKLAIALVSLLPLYIIIRALTTSFPL